MAMHFVFGESSLSLIYHLVRLMSPWIRCQPYKNVNGVYSVVCKYIWQYYQAYVYLANNLYYLMEELLRSLFCTAAAEFP